jgi:hypothetical protein
MVYPTAEGPLVVTYRSIQIGSSNVTSAAAASPAAAGSRHLLQAAAAAPAPAVCVGSMQGLGLSGRNVCFVAQQEGEPLPPGVLKCQHDIKYLVISVVFACLD